MLQPIVRVVAVVGVIVTAPIVYLDLTADASERSPAPDPVATLSADVSQEAWCDDVRRGGDGYRHCEVRSLTLPADGALEIVASPNGGVSVEAADVNEVEIRARVTSHARDPNVAEGLVDEVRIEVAGHRVRARGPRTEDRRSWSVSYRVRTPPEYDLNLSSTNGGLGVEGVRGRMELETTNGGLRLVDVGGDVRGRTTNGGLDIELTGSSWRGAGLDVRTTNGGVVLALPEEYSAELEAGTTNGGFDLEFPVTLTGRINRTLTTRLGQGGAPIRVRTTNGGVVLRRR